MYQGPLSGVGSGNSLSSPDVVIRPILLLLSSVNQIAPSDPTVIPFGLLSGVGSRNSVTFPAVVMRPTLLPKNSVNQSAPSGPVTT